MLWYNNTTWDENLIGKTTVVDGEEVIDTVAKEAVARFQEWISDVPRLKELRFKRYERGHLEPTPKASRSRSSTRPYPKMDAPQSKNAQPGEASATAANPEPASPEVTEATAEPSDGNRRSKRARHRSGYYTELLKGKK